MKMIFSELKLKVALIVIGAIFVFGCAREPVVARVNGEAITQKELKAMLARAGMKEGTKVQQEGGIPKAMREGLINQLINEKLVLQAAKKENIRVDKKEVIKTYNDMVKAFPKEEDYLKRLKEKGISKDMMFKSIEKDLIMGKFMDSISRDITLSDVELKDYYDKNLQAFTTPEQLRLSIIRVDNIDEAKKIKKEIEKGADFEEMANKYPAGHGGPGVGETNWVTLDTFPPDMVKEIKRIRAGTFGGPIKGKEGYYIIKVQERKEKKVQPFDEVKEGIRNILIQQKKGERFQSWLQDTRGKAKIEILQKG